MLLAYVQIGMFYIRYCTYASYIASKPFCDAPCLRLTHTCFPSEVREVSKTGPDQSNRSIMAEYGREGCAALSSHCAQSLHICPKGNAQTSYGW